VAVLPSGWGIALCLVEPLFGGAQFRFESFELLCLGGDSLLPARMSEGVWRKATMAAYFSRTVLSRISRLPSSLNRLSSSDMKAWATVLQTVVSMGGSYVSAGRGSRLRAVGWLPAVVWVFHGRGLCRVGGGHDGLSEAKEGAAEVGTMQAICGFDSKGAEG
jgi:hypothetical protein